MCCLSVVGTYSGTPGDDGVAEAGPRCGRRLVPLSGEGGCAGRVSCHYTWPAWVRVCTFSSTHVSLSLSLSLSLSVGPSPGVVVRSKRGCGKKGRKGKVSSVAALGNAHERIQPARPGQCLASRRPPPRVRTGIYRFNSIRGEVVVLWYCTVGLRVRVSIRFVVMKLKVTMKVRIGL